MSWIFDYSPVFFDFDGLLVNTEHLHFEAYKNMLEGEGIPFPWDFFTFAAVAHKSAEGLREMITAHAPQLVHKKTWDTLYDLKKKEYAKLLEGGDLELMPGADVVLKEVLRKGIAHAVVTNSTRAQTEKIRENIPSLNAIPYWITREDYKNAKPAPDAYLKAIEVLGTSDKMLGFEDSLRGVHALQGAGITPVLICPPDHPQMAEVAEGSLHYAPTFNDLLKKSCSDAYTTRDSKIGNFPK